MSGGWGTAKTNGNVVPITQSSKTQQGWIPGGYSADAFYTRATNAHDHAQTVYFKVRPDLFAEMERFVGDPDFPEYKTVGDVLRDAVVHRLAYLTNQIDLVAHRERLQAYLLGLALDEAQLEAEYQVAKWEEQIEARRKFWAKLADLGDWYELERQMELTLDMTVSYGPMYRQPYEALIAEMNKRFPADYERQL